MGLFSIAAPAAMGGSTDGTKTSNSNSSLSIPTIIQLHTGKAITWENTSANCLPKYAILSYQAIETNPPGSEGETSGGAGGLLLSMNMNNKNVQQHTHPNLGIWNCRVVAKKNNGSSDGESQKQEPIIDYILKIPSSVVNNNSTTTRSFCFRVDLNDLSNVEPTISLLQDALIRYLIASEQLQQQQQKQQGEKDDEKDGDIKPTLSSDEKDSTKDDDNKQQFLSAGTTLYDLKSTHFGLAPNDESETAKKMKETKLDPNDKNIKVALIICAIVDSKKSKKKQQKTDDEYHEKQSKALIYYHLRRYVAKLNACLCFVQANTNKKDSVAPISASSPEDEAVKPEDSKEELQGDHDDGEEKQLNTITLDQLSYTLQQLALGKEAWKDGEMTTAITTKTTEQPQENSEEQAAAGDSPAVGMDDDTKIYGPGKHQEDLIETVLMRNANYPGHWDASKDSIWKALPSSADDEHHMEDPQKTEEDNQTGDQAWLGQLRESVGVPNEPAKTPQTKKKEEGAGEKGAKTPNDAAVTDFFASLMQK